METSIRLSVGPSSGSHFCKTNISDQTEEISAMTVGKSEQEHIVMDEESMRQFFYLISGIPYESEDNGSRWA